jgi:Putative zinc-finger
MKCSDEQISALVDGDLPPRTAVRVRAHIDSCARCKAEEAALTQMRSGLASLPAPEPSDPKEDGWLDLVKKLQSEPAAPPPRFWQRWSWRRWVLAPSFATVAIVTALVFWQRGRGLSDETLLQQAEVEFRGAESQYQRALDKLERVTDHAQGEWPAARQTQYQTARAALEAATDQCRKVAHARPADAEAEELLFAAYRKQISFYEEQLLQ